MHGRQEYTAKLLQYLKESGERKIESNPGLPPWKALYAEHRVAPHYGNDIPWQHLVDAQFSSSFQSIRVMVSAQGTFWGLTHDKDMPGVFVKSKADYERTAAEAIPSGLAVSAQFPWSSLEHFYETCEDLVRAFESVRPPLLREVPSALRTAPEVAPRLRT